jgi:hypothetical protein
LNKNFALLSGSGLIIAALLFSCADKSTAPAGGLDLSVVGNWEGAMGAIPLIHFTGERIFANLSGRDSTFVLITRDPTKDTTSAIKDTTLVMTGNWTLNAGKDSVLLAPHSCRIIDTATNTLRSRVIDQTIPVFIKIAKDASGVINWDIAMSDFLPLAPLLGLNLPPLSPSVWQAVRIILEKMSQ